MAERGPLRPVGDGEFTFRNVQLLKNETLGTGSYGAVCKAKCDQLICAAKLLYPVLFQMQAPDPGKEHRRPFRRFEEECRFLSQINHPNIVQYLGTYHDSETNAPVLLMELMDESLTHFLESSPGDIPYHIQVNLSHDIAQALAFLHVNGIIHRDLSSNNVLLIAGSRAKVTDFGMSKFTDLNATRLATLTQCPGTPAFMSPEALDEPPVYTEKLDNFSFGVLLVQVVTRQFPAPGDRFETVEIPSPRNPTRTVRSRVLIPEVERRQAHISLIESTHPLLPIALECLKDETVDRPSSQQLCQSLDTLKRDARFEESLRIVFSQLLQEKEMKIQEKEQQLHSKDEDITALRDEIEAKNRELQDKDDIIKTKDEIILARDSSLLTIRFEVQAGKTQLQEKAALLSKKEAQIQAIQHEVESYKKQLQKKDAILREFTQSLQEEVKAKELQLRRLNQQQESREEITATLHASVQRNKEISKSEQLGPSLEGINVSNQKNVVEQKELIKDDQNKKPQDSQLETSEKTSSTQQTSMTDQAEGEIGKLKASKNSESSHEPPSDGTNVDQTPSDYSREFLTQMVNDPTVRMFFGDQEYQGDINALDDDDDDDDDDEDDYDPYLDY